MTLDVVIKNIVVIGHSYVRYNMSKGFH